MGLYGSKYVKTLLLSEIALKVFLSFFLNGPHNSIGWDFFNFFNFSRFLFVFANMGPYEGKSFKTPLLPHNAFEIFQTSPEFSSQLFLQKRYLVVSNFYFPILRGFFSRISHAPLLLSTNLFPNNFENIVTQSWEFFQLPVSIDF